MQGIDGLTYAPPGKFLSKTEESEEFSYIDIGEERCSKIHIGILKRNLKGILFVKNPVPPPKK